MQVREHEADRPLDQRPKLLPRVADRGDLVGEVLLRGLHEEPARLLLVRGEEREPSARGGGCRSAAPAPRARRRTTRPPRAWCRSCPRPRAAPPRPRFARTAPRWRPMRSLNSWRLPRDAAADTRLPRGSFATVVSKSSSSRKSSARSGSTSEASRLSRSARRASALASSIRISSAASARAVLASLAARRLSRRHSRHHDFLPLGWARSFENSVSGSARGPSWSGAEHRLVRGCMSLREYDARAAPVVP